jgi:putative peptidoglycan lipid II flippase
MSTQRTVTKAAAIMMVAITLSRALGLVRDMVISGTFGQGLNTDIYYAAFNLPDLLFYLIAGGALSSAFVPVFVEYISAGKKKEAWHLFSIIATVMAVVVGVFILFGEIFTRQLIPIVAPGYHGAAAERVVHLTRIVLPAQFFFLLGALMMASLWAHQQFVAPGLGPSIYNIGIITGGAVAGSLFGPQLGIDGLAWGALAGAFFGNFVLQFAVLRRYGLEFKACFNARHPDAIRVWKLMVPVIFSLSLPQVDVWINRNFATMLPAGELSALDRANRLMQVPIGIFGQAIAIGLYTSLAAQFSLNKIRDFRETVNYGLRAILLVSIPATALMIILRRPIIEFLFQHGRFNSHATDLVSLALVFYAAGILAWSMQALVARAFYSMQNTVIPVVTGTIMTAIFIPMNYGLMKLMGFTGLALATTIAATGHTIIMMYLLQKKAGGIGGKRLLTSFVKISAASAVMGASMWATLIGVQTLLPANMPFKTAAGVRLLLPMLVGGTLFVLMIRALKLEESAVVLDMIKRRFSRRRATSDS